MATDIRVPALGRKRHRGQRSASGSRRSATWSPPTSPVVVELENRQGDHRSAGAVGGRARGDLGAARRYRQCRLADRRHRRRRRRCAQAGRSGSGGTACSGRRRGAGGPQGRGGSGCSGACSYPRGPAAAAERQWCGATGACRRQADGRERPRHWRRQRLRPPRTGAEGRCPGRAHPAGAAGAAGERRLRQRRDRPAGPGCRRRKPPGSRRRRLPRAPAAPTPAPRPAIVAPAAAPAPAPQPRGRSPRPTRRAKSGVKMTRLRQTIARRLKDAQNNAAMLTTFKRGGHEADHGSAHAVQGSVRKEARREAGLHGLLHAGRWCMR